MGKKLEYTSRKKLYSIIRKYIWMWSRERAAALRRTGYRCGECNKKQTRVKGKELILEVHHLDGAHIDLIIDEIYKYLLCHPDRLVPLCGECHKKKG